MMACNETTETVNNMTQEVFNWISRSVNKDFIRMGYPAILTKKGNKDFVSLSALMQNCSAVLTLVKAKEIGDEAAETEAEKAGHQPEKRKKKRIINLFSSSSASSANSAAKGLRQLQQMSVRMAAELAAAKLDGDGCLVAAFEAMLDTVRSDTESVIEATDCLGEGHQKFGAQTGRAQHQQLAVYFTTRWPQFVEAVTQRLQEAVKVNVELQALRATSALVEQKLGYQQGSIQTSTQRSKSVSDSGRGGGFVGDENRHNRLSDDIDERTVTAVAAVPTASNPDASGTGYPHPSHQRSLSCRRAAAHGGNGLFQPPPPPGTVQHANRLEAEIRRLKLELSRSEQRHKAELDRQARDRERMTREFRRAQRRTPGPRWPTTARSGSLGRQQLQQRQQQRQDQRQEPGRDAVDRLANSLGLLNRHEAPDALAGHQPNQKQQQQPTSGIPVKDVCLAALARIEALQADSCTSQRRQESLEAALNVLKSRLGLGSDLLDDVRKFDSAIADIVGRINPGKGDETGGVGGGGSGGGGGGATNEEKAESLVSRLAHRLRDRQRVL